MVNKREGRLSLAELCTKYGKVLRHCSLLEGIAPEAYEEALSFFRARPVALDKHEILQRLDEPFRYGGIVLFGSLEGSFLNENDAKISVSRFEPGRLYGEALGCVQPPHSPIQLEAIRDSLVLLLDLSALHQEAASLAGIQYHLAMNLIHGLAGRNVYQHQKLRILSQKKLRDRIAIFLGGLPHTEDGAAVVKLTTTAMAEFLGVSRSALSREIGALQDEGVLRIEGEKFYFQQEI